MSNSFKYIEAFKNIEAFLRKKLNARTTDNFSDLLRRGLDTRFKFLIKKLADFRNILAHDSKITRTSHHQIAEPSEQAIAYLLKIYSQFTASPTISKDFLKPVFTCNETDFLVDVLPEMNKLKISQAPVVNRQNHIVDLLSFNTIATWLSSSLKNDFGGIDSVEIKDLLRLKEAQEKFKIIRKDAPVWEVIVLFEEEAQKGFNLNACIVTENGKAKEKIVGILNTSDLPKMHKSVNS